MHLRTAKFVHTPTFVRIQLGRGRFHPTQSCSILCAFALHGLHRGICVFNGSPVKRFNFVLESHQWCSQLHVLLSTVRYRLPSTTHDFVARRQAFASLFQKNSDSSLLLSQNANFLLIIIDYSLQLRATFRHRFQQVDLRIQFGIRRDDAFILLAAQFSLNRFLRHPKLMMKIAFQHDYVSWRPNSCACVNV